MIVCKKENNGFIPTIEGRLERPQFSAYLNTCKGVSGRKAVRQNGKFSHWLLPLQELSSFLSDLVAQGLPCGVEPALQGLIEGQNAPEEDQKASLDLSGLIPQGWALYDHQGPGVSFLASRVGALLGDDMGLGKTLQGSLALAHLLREQKITRAVIQAPVSVLGSWEKTLRLCGIPTIREGFPDMGEVLLLSWAAKTEDLACWIRNGIACAWIGDEIHYAKKIRFGQDGQPIPSKSSARAIRAYNLARACRDGGGVSWGFSGTPIDNGKFEEFFGVAHVIGIGNALFPKGFFECASAFSVTWEKRFVRTKKRVNGRLEEVSRQVSIPHQGDPQPWFVRRLSQHMLRRSKEQVLDLPPITFLDREVEVSSPALRTLMDACEDRLEEWEQQGGGDKLPEFTEFSRCRRLLAEAKVEALLGLIKDHEEESGDPLAVFSCHLAPVEACLELGFGTITGSDSTTERQATIDAFQSGSLPGVAYTLAGCEGITLTQASVLVAVDLDWRPGKNQQAFDRLHRIGQGKPVFVIRLIANHALDRRLMDRVEKKARVHDLTINAVERLQNAQKDLLQVVQVVEATENTQENPKASSVPSKPISKVGMYRREGVVYRVNENANTGRLNVWQLNPKTGSFSYAKGVIYKLREEDRLTVEEAAEFGHTNGFCMCCGRELSNAESMELGIGPICMRKYF